MKDFIRSSTAKRLVAAVAVILVIVVVFSAGVAVGYHRGVYLFQWNERYLRGFADPRSIFAPFERMPDSANSHGVVGKIVSVSLPSLMIQGKDSAEQVVAISATTTIRAFRDATSTSALKVGANVIVIGLPDKNGTIDAEFIRVMP
jgi:hypothetical protein